MSDSFDDFIRKQSQSPTGGPTSLTPDQEKTNWLAQLGKLYALIRESLQKYIDDGTVNFEITDFPLHEQLIGNYTASAARIILGRQVVTLEPIGTYLIGARGRVDMTGPRGIARFVIVPRNAQRPRVDFNVSNQGDSFKASEVLPPEAWIWKISTPPPRITYTELNTESFQAALMGVMGSVDLNESAFPIMN